MKSTERGEVDGGTRVFDAGIESDEVTRRTRRAVALAPTIVAILWAGLACSDRALHKQPQP